VNPEVTTQSEEDSQKAAEAEKEAQAKDAASKPAAKVAKTSPPALKKSEGRYLRAPLTGLYKGVLFGSNQVSIDPVPPEVEKALRDHFGDELVAEADPRT
jgi:hypothetical protein